MYNPKCSTHDEKFAEWTKLIGQCIQSGEPIAQWCKENGVSNSRFHYWQKRVYSTIESLKSASMAMEASGILPVGDSAVEVPAATGSMPGLVQVNLRRSAATNLAGDNTEGACAATGPTLVMSVRIGEACCDIYNGADSGAIERTLAALTKIC